MTNYWRDRELKHIKEKVKDDATIAKRIAANQRRAMDDIETQIDAFYGRYATKEGITPEEARKRVAKVDIEKYSVKAKQYVEEKNFSPRANEEMRLYNVTMRTNRLELLKANTHLELIAMTEEEQKIILDSMMKGATEEYKRQSGILGQSLNYNEKNIDSIVNSSFSNATWSDRVWDNQDALRSELDRLLNRGVVQGKNPRELARELRKMVGSSIYNSERIMRTEMARVQGDVFLDSLKQIDVKQYIYIAEPTACKYCSALDGEIFDVKDMEIGINMYPMHPNCRCSTSAYIEREE